MIGALVFLCSVVQLVLTCRTEELSNRVFACDRVKMKDIMNQARIEYGL